MKKIKVTTVKEVIAEVSFCDTTISDQEVINTIKANGMVSGYDEIKIHANDKVILFLKYKHVFTIIA